MAKSQLVLETLSPEDVAPDSPVACSSDRRPTCTRCHQPWRWPRNLAHVTLVSGVPQRIKPTTKATVVAHLTSVPGSQPPRPTICDRVFRRLELLHSQRGLGGCINANRITTKFLYHTETGHVRYDADAMPEEGFGFARLITLNSWYAALFKGLVVAAFNVLDLHANVLLVFLMLTDHEDELVASIGGARYAFAAGWIAMLGLSLLMAAHSAWVEWAVKAGPSVGDLVRQCGPFDAMVIFAAMTCFSFFGVEQQVKDIVTVLHPWKSIQPYAAFKMDGARAYVVGYLDENLFRVENVPAFYTMLAQLLLRTFVFGFKFYFMIVHTHSELVASVASSSFSICYGWFKWANLHSARRKLEARLLGILREERASDEHWERQREAAKKLLALHFRYRARQGQGEVIQRTFSIRQQRKPECPKCGRDLVGKAAAQAEDGALRVGDRVQLSSGYRNFHDAKYGPLQPHEPAEVLEIGPRIPICGSRSLVRTESDETWWYDEGALEPSTQSTRAPSKEAPEEALAQELARLLESLQQQQQPAVRHAYAKKLRQAAEALEAGKDGLRSTPVNGTPPVPDDVLALPGTVQHAL